MNRSRLTFSFFAFIMSPLCSGEMSERFKVQLSKSCEPFKGSEGSNPSLSVGEKVVEMPVIYWLPQFFYFIDNSK